MNKIKKTIFIILIILLSVISVNLFGQINEYEKQFIGTWENNKDTDLFVFEEKNVVYFLDEYGGILTEKGRWKANAKNLFIELKFNGKKYRSIMEYEVVNPSEIKLELIKNIIDGEEQKLDETKVTIKRID